MVDDERAYGEADTFAQRLLWIIAADYEDEGVSALLPLLALAEVLDAAADVAKDPNRKNLDRLDARLAALNDLQRGQVDMRRRRRYRFLLWWYGCRLAAGEWLIERGAKALGQLVAGR